MARKMGITQTGEVPSRHFPWQILLVVLVVLVGVTVLGLSQTLWKTPTLPVPPPQGGLAPVEPPLTPTKTPTPIPTPAFPLKIEVKWESSQLPDPGAYPHGLAIVDSRGERLFATGYYHGEDWKGALWKSEDGSRSWSKVLDEHFTTNIILDPTNLGVMYLGKRSEVLKSVDGGNTWTVAWRSGLTGDFRIDEQGVWWLYEPQSSAPVWKSENPELRTWVRAGNMEWGTIVPGKQRDPNNPNNILRVVSVPKDVDPNTNIPFWKFELSIDGGKSWLRVNMPPPLEEKSDFFTQRESFALISTEKEIKIFFAKYQAWRTTIPLESLPR